MLKFANPITHHGARSSRASNTFTPVVNGSATRV
jgi:hypothetical protein